MKEYTVGQLARLAHVSVRTLHHYDSIGLLMPSGRSGAGYRRYSDRDLQRLEQVLFYRELAFGLDEIIEILADPDTGADDHLRRQHQLVRQRIAHGRALLGAIEKEMEARQMGISLTPEEQFEIFGSDKFGGQYAEEAEQRWGNTDAWRHSQRRAAAYTKEDWTAIKSQGDTNLGRLAAALRRGDPATAAVAMDLAEAHRQHISAWFYDCGYDMHRGLAAMYLSDPRFTATYEAVAPGLAQYVHDAMVANADRAAGS
jgi:DNA-binding transcriptional MerR regulator